MRCVRRIADPRATGNDDEVPPRTLVLGSLAGLLAFGTSCEPKCERLPPGPDGDETGKGERPHLVEGQFASSTVVELAFSEALAPVDAVDPEKFRLGIVELETERVSGRCRKSVEYCDLSTNFSEYGCGVGYSGLADPTRVTALDLDDDDASVLQLRIDPPLSQELCLRIDDSENKVGIQVFFSAADAPTVEDLDGESLADIAAHWVLGEDARTEQDDFDALHHWVPIACPEHF